MVRKLRVLVTLGFLIFYFKGKCNKIHSPYKIVLSRSRVLYSQFRHYASCLERSWFLCHYSIPYETIDLPKLQTLIIEENVI